MPATECRISINRIPVDDCSAAIMGGGGGIWVSYLRTSVFYFDGNWHTILDTNLFRVLVSRRPLTPTLINKLRHLMTEIRIPDETI